jgi:hypothetical protein
LATTGGTARRKALIEAARWLSSPMIENKAATVMKNGNSERIAM